MVDPYALSDRDLLIWVARQGALDSARRKPYRILERERELLDTAEELLTGAKQTYSVEGVSAKRLASGGVMLTIKVLTPHLVGEDGELYQR